MFLTLVASSLLARSGVIAIEGLAVGVLENGKWRTADAGRQDPTRKYATSPNFTLKKSGLMEPSTFELKYNDEDEIPSLQAWFVEPMGAEEREPAIWFGPMPKSPKMVFASPGSPVYYGAVQSYLKSKGIKNPKPRLDSVVLVDLDGNGTQEAVIFTTSRKHDDMWGTLSLDGESKRPGDFAAVLIRYVSGKKVRTVEALYSDGRKGSLEGFWVNCGIWDLDGIKGAEILIGSRYYEGGGGIVLSFSGGKIKKLAEHAVGV